MKAKTKRVNNLDEYFNTLIQRYYKWLTYLYNKNLSFADDKEVFKQICIKKSRATYSFYVSDAYMNDMIEIFKDNYNQKLPMKEIIDKIQKIRIEWKDQQFLGTEYNQDYIPVYNLVNDERDTKIVKLIITYVANLKFFTNNLK